MTEYQITNILLFVITTGSMFGVTFGVIARFLGDREII